MSLSEHERHESTGVPQSLPHDAVEVVDVDGNRLRFARGDFEETYTTSDARQMRRHLRCGWLLLDERVGRDPGRSGSWIESAPRRSAGRVLAGQDDPQYVPPRDVTTYVLGLLKTGASGMPVE